MILMSQMRRAAAAAIAWGIVVLPCTASVIVLPIDALDTVDVNYTDVEADVGGASRGSMMRHLWGLVGEATISTTRLASASMALPTELPAAT